MSRRLNRAQPYALGLFRIVVGLLFACHGAASLFGVLGGAMGGGTVPAGTWPGWYAAVIQLVGGTLVAARPRHPRRRVHRLRLHGVRVLQGPPAARRCSRCRTAARRSAIFCWAFLLLVFTGPGALALDRLFATRAGVAAPGRPHPRAGAGGRGLTAAHPTRRGYPPAPRGAGAVVVPRGT